jgi:hypothetical protein
MKMKQHAPKKNKKKDRTQKSLLKSASSEVGCQTHIPAKGA